MGSNYPEVEKIPIRFKDPVGGPIARVFPGESPIPIPTMRILILTLVLGLSLPLVARAQASASESATVTANVVATLAITKNQNLAFGDVAQGTSSTIAVTDADAVKFTVSGEPNKAVTFSLTSPSTLADGSSHTLPFTSAVQYNTTDNAASANALTNNSTINLSAGGHLFVYLGGTVTAAVGQTTGLYSGTYTVQVDY